MPTGYNCGHYVMQVIPPVFKKEQRYLYFGGEFQKRKSDFLSSPQNGDAGYAFPVCLLKV